MILNTAQSLFEVAECWRKIVSYFRSEAVSKILSKCPQLLGRMVRFLRAIDFDHEVEVVVEEVCGVQNTTLSPSDPAWLDWCQPRIERPERYGKRAEVLSRCVDVLFRFLDFGSNRSSGRAWVLLHTVVQLVDPGLFVTIWAQRYDWWPRFHTVPLPAEAASRRAELLEALAGTPID
ncbi:hypothetical protein COOONC_17827 [Cooperia oncophora]